MLSIKCPNCGGTVQFDESHIATFCSFCGAHLPDMTEYVKSTANLKIEQQKHVMEMETADKEIRKDKVRSVTGTISNVFDLVRLILFVICILAVFSPIILLLLKMR